MRIAWGMCNIKQHCMIIVPCGSLLVACHIQSKYSVVIVLAGLSTQTNL